MQSWFAFMVAVVLVSVALSGCAAAPPSQPEPALPPPTAAPPAGETPPSSGTRLAPGLYELEDGTAQALGTLDYRDLEGGFWQVTGGTEAEGDVGKVIAVIANGADFESQLTPLKGAVVSVTGERLRGASIRMAGPEIKMTSVEAINDTPGPAE